MMRQLADKTQAPRLKSPGTPLEKDCETKAGTVRIASTQNENLTRFFCQNKPSTDVLSVAMQTIMNKSTDDSIPTRRSLLVRLKDWDDQKSWQDFFDTYWKLIYGVARKAGLSDAEAQDVVQETVITVTKKMNEFKYDPALGSFKGWLMTITRWRIGDLLRKRLPVSGGSDECRDETSRTPTIERVPDPDALVLDAMWDEEWQKNITDAALNRLKRRSNPEHYQLFDFYSIKGWSVEDIVKTLDVSEAQVYKVNSRMSALLKKEIEYLKTKMI